MMLDVARNGGDGDPVSLANVAERTGISRGYLEQLALALRTARLVRGVAGRHGGYRLTTPPTEITLGQIVEAAIGPIYLVDCLEDPTTCPRAEYCECRVVYALINRRIQEVLREYTLKDLLDPSWLQHVGSEATVQLVGLGTELVECDRDQPRDQQCPMCTESKT
jgi:Rrf2 family protein